ncbi:hypothetical protein [Arthrobacter sp. SD76]|uniref:hypothetical protein n=1 Tax=Arthrobacter sp. SD76 TaxID=3415007 RepID=UPI003C795AC7
MSEPQGQRQRMQPRMGRGSWRAQMLLYGLLTLIAAILALGKLGMNNTLDVVSFCLYAVWFLINVGYFVHLIRVSHNDKPFWDEEEALREDWERRGRQL